MLALPFSLGANCSTTAPLSDTSNCEFADLMGNISSNTIAFMLDVITGYWGVILSISFVLFMIALFWRMAKMKGQ